MAVTEKGEGAAGNGPLPVGEIIKLPIAEILVGERFRKKLGIRDEEVASIRRLGLLQPVVITPEKRLIAGQRRLEAWKRLG